MLVSSETQMYPEPANQTIDHPEATTILAFPLCIHNKYQYINTNANTQIQMPIHKTNTQIQMPIHK